MEGGVSHPEQPEPQVVGVDDFADDAVDVLVLDPFDGVPSAKARVDFAVGPIQPSGSSIAFRDRDRRQSFEDVEILGLVLALTSLDVGRPEAELFGDEFREHVAFRRMAIGRKDLDVCH